MAPKAVPTGSERGTPEVRVPAPRTPLGWDITKLLGPAKWTYFYLYVILDVFSRYVVGWMVADREGKELARQFIADTCAKRTSLPANSPSTPITARR